MQRFRRLAIAGTIALMAGVPTSVSAGGSSGGYTSHGGYASHGGSSGGYVASYASGGGYASAGGSSSGGASSGGASSGGSVGPIRRLFAKVRAHRAARMAGASSGGASSGGASSGGASSGGSSSGYVAQYGSSSGGSSSGGYVATHGSAGTYASGGGASSGYVASSYSMPLVGTPVSTPMLASGTVLGSASVPSTGSIAYESPVISQPISQSVATSVASDDTSSSTRYISSRTALEADAASLRVTVPHGAVVTVNDHPTTSEGESRKFKSRGLKKGYVYTYVVKATYEVDGEEMTQTKSVKLRLGDQKELAFDAATASQSIADESDAAAPVAKSEDVAEDLVTVVQLTVPQDAKVVLAGNPTKGTGIVRTFRTKQLKKGQRWDNYTVSVTSELSGQPVTKQRTIEVEAGSTNQLVFEFDTADSLASK
ncbi:MAG: TIGR03000 domain-containing protein [Planctomycetota bacterium]